MIAVTIVNKVDRWRERRVVLQLPLQPKRRKMPRCFQKLKRGISAEKLGDTTYVGYGGKDGGDEGIRTLDLLSASYTQKPVVVGFQQLTPCTERNNAEESRNFRNLSATCYPPLLADPFSTPLLAVCRWIQSGFTLKHIPIDRN